MEQCIDNIEHCKAALFILEKNKNKGFCQLYGANSNSTDNNIIPDNSLNSISTVFEVLDKCRATNDSKSTGNDLVEEMKLELKQKLELWPDPELPFSPTPQIVQQHSKNDKWTRKRTRNENLNDKTKLKNESHFDKFIHREEYQKWVNKADQERMSERFSSSNYEPVKPVIGRLVSLAQNVFNPSFSPYTNKLLLHANYYPPILLQTFNNNDNYLPKQDYSLPTSGIPLPAPIKPISIKHGRQRAFNSRCQGSNCYIPIPPYFQKSGYIWPCSTYPNPCESNMPDPCFTTCFPISTSYNPIPKTTTMFNQEWSGSDIDKQQSSSELEKKELLQYQDSPYSSLQSLSTPAQSTEHMIISWSEWSPQTPCSVTCGIGITTWKRFCSIDGRCPGKYFQPISSGKFVKEELCTNNPCPKWSPWSEWTECSRSCGGGERSRSRVCSVRLQCDGPSVNIQACNVEKCPQWSSWSNWETCSVTCGIGQQIRRRQCVGSNMCTGESFEKKACKQPLCFAWSTWEPWSMCSVSCGKGQRHRERICYNSNSCIGNREEHEICTKDSCPEWTDWSSWTQCSETCGTKGNKLRTRTCIKDNLISALCDGAAQDQMACKDLPECPRWVSWSSWSICSVTCGHGQENRHRSCLPMGMKCIGAKQEFRFCQKSVCPYWDEWSLWSTCSVTCGTGIRERRRKCMNDNITRIVAEEGFSSGDMAKSIKQELMPLHMKNLIVDDTKTSDSTMHRSNSTLSIVPSVDENISVVRAIRDSNGCSGNAVDREQCNPGRCCKLSEWTTWTACSLSCGGGTRQRHRMCSSQDEPQNYGFSGSPCCSKMTTPGAFEYYKRSNYERQGFQPIVPIKRLIDLVRVRQRTANVHDFGSFEQDSLISKLDESICHCDGKLHEESMCAEIPCPETRNVNMCSWSHWTEWCRCIGSCNQSNWIRTRYCAKDIPANDGISNSSYSLASDECLTMQNSRTLTVEQNATGHLYSSRLKFHDFSQYNCNQIVPTFNRDIGMDCLWSSWNINEGEFRTRRRSCNRISTKTKCHCNGSLMEQISCSCPRMEIIRSNHTDHTTAKLTSPPSVITPKGITVPEERVIAYRSNFSISSCSWSQWGIWSVCSETCSAGKTIRKRFCPCKFCSFGESTEVKSCELISC